MRSLEGSRRVFGSCGISENFRDISARFPEDFRGISFIQRAGVNATLTLPDTIHRCIICNERNDGTAHTDTPRPQRTPTPCSFSTFGSIRSSRTRMSHKTRPKGRRLAWPCMTHPANTTHGEETKTRHNNNTQHLPPTIIIINR